MKSIIRGATVYDGTASAPQQLDLLIENEHIAAMGTELGTENAAIIDATGYTVTPGFIDMHRHCDIAPLRDEEFGLLELSQGITTAIAGNCGLAPVPIGEEYRLESCDFLEPVVGKMAHHHAFATYQEYFDALEAASPAIHVGVLAGAGAIKTTIKGFGQSCYTPNEIKMAAGFVKKAMNEGAFGVSLGIMYQPECYSTAKELAQLVLPAAETGGLLTAHIRGEGDGLVASVQEVIEVAKKTGMRLNISHFKATGIKNWNNTIYKAIDCIDEAIAEGLEVTADFYPYAGGATTLLSLVPPSALKGGGEGTLKFLATPEGKAQVRREVYKTHPLWDNMALSIGWERILISSTNLPQHEGYGGQTIAHLAAKNGYSDPSDFICDLLVSEKGRVGIIVLSMSQDDVDTVAKLPYTAIISDALYDGSNTPHPRLYGAFPKVIREYVLERGVLPMQTAIYKMTGLPAKILRMENRGLLKKGYQADINIFKPEELRDNAVYTDSKQLSSGMHLVLIGGKTVYKDGRMLPAHSAGLLRKGKGPL